MTDSSSGEIYYRMRVPALPDSTLTEFKGIIIRFLPPKENEYNCTLRERNTKAVTGAVPFEKVMN